MPCAQRGHAMLTPQQGVGFRIACHPERDRRPSAIASQTLFSATQGFRRSAQATSRSRATIERALTCPASGSHAGARRTIHVIHVPPSHGSRGGGTSTPTRVGLATSFAVKPRPIDIASHGTPGAFVPSSRMSRAWRIWSAIPANATPQNDALSWCANVLGERSFVHLRPERERPRVHRALAHCERRCERPERRGSFIRGPTSGTGAGAVRSGRMRSWLAYRSCCHS